MADTRPTTVPTVEEKDDLLLACRYGDLEDVQTFVERFNAASLEHITDDNGNTILHMISANGHTDLLSYILALPSFPTSLLQSTNSSGSTPLHWASLNSHLGIAQSLVKAGGPQLIDIKNKAGRSPLGEAEMAGWEDGAKYFVTVMVLGKEGETDESDEKIDPEQSIEVTIEDAEGGVAKMTLGGNSEGQSSRP